MEIDTIVIDNIRYVIIKEMVINNQKYVYLSNIDDPSDTWSEVQDFSGNIPYELNGLCYFFAKPNVSTTLGSKTTKVGSGQVEQLYFSGGEPSNR